MPLIPIVIERSGREERAMDIYSRLLQDRIIILGSAIDDQVANVIVAQTAGPRPPGQQGRHPPLHQLPRRLRHRRHGDLRHHAVRPLRRRRPTAWVSAPAWVRSSSPPEPRASATPCRTAGS